MNLPWLDIITFYSRVFAQLMNVTSQTSDVKTSIHYDNLNQAYKPKTSGHAGDTLKNNVSEKIIIK